MGDDGLHACWRQRGTHFSHDGGEGGGGCPGLLTLKEFLYEADVLRVEAVLVRCAKEADEQVNNKEYPNELYPSDKECNRVVGYTSRGKKITRAMELGTMKHAVAFACIERELGLEFSDYLTREPRYGKKPPDGKYVMTDELMESLVPDVVLHRDPLGYQRQTLKQKLGKYKELPGADRRALVTPQLGVSR